jgi:hypothetical protein
MTDTLFKIGAPDFDTAAVVAEVRARVEANRKTGLYQDPRVARAEIANFANIKNEDDLLAFYFECMRDSVFVDINDFEISERRAYFSRLLIAFKRVIWKLLKFYTYRLWTQQNQINGLLMAIMETSESRHRETIQKLEARIAELEKTSAGKRAPSS